MQLDPITDQPLSILIKNGTIVDGSGSPRYTADIAIYRDRVIDIGHFLQADTGHNSYRVIDAAGKVVAPGFIDTHVHSELAMLQGKHTAGIEMGVTTELLSPDGFSFAPLSPQRLTEYRAYLHGLYGDADVDWNWHDYETYLQRFPGHIYNNIMPVVPHGAIHLAVKGWEDRPANQDELQAMSRLVQACLEAGCSGISTGLDYTPASHATLEELIALSRLAGRSGGVYATHMRGYDDATRDKAIGEVLAIAREAEMGVHINHFFGNDSIYAAVEKARAESIDITFDTYPYPAGCTLLTFIFPRTLITCAVQDFLRDLAAPAMRAMVSAAIEAKLPENNPAYFAYVRLAKNKWMEGKTVRQAWHDNASGQSFSDFVIQLLLEEELGPLLVYPWPMDEEEKRSRLKTSITHPLQMFITDGIYMGSQPHPRGWGTFPRVLGQYVREQSWLTLEDAVRRMAGFPAARYGIRGRGLVKPGMYADLVIFDPHTVSDRATFEQPMRSPQGIEMVLVNGQVVVEQGKHLPGQYAGRRLAFQTE